MLREQPKISLNWPYVCLVVHHCIFRKKIVIDLFSSSISNFVNLRHRLFEVPLNQFEDAKKIANKLKVLLTKGLDCELSTHYSLGSTVEKISPIHLQVNIVDIKVLDTAYGASINEDFVYMYRNASDDQEVNQKIIATLKNQEFTIFGITVVFDLDEQMPDDEITYRVVGDILSLNDIYSAYGLIFQQTLLHEVIFFLQLQGLEITALPCYLYI